MQLFKTPLIGSLLAFAYQSTGRYYQHHGNTNFTPRHDRNKFVLPGLSGTGKQECARRVRQMERGFLTRSAGVAA